jgi:hypothetical protein
MSLGFSESEEDWPNREVCERSGNFADKHETDLAEIWPAFADARAAATNELKIKNAKDARIYREAVNRAAEPPALLTELLADVRGLAA